MGDSILNKKTAKQPKNSKKAQALKKVAAFKKKASSVASVADSNDKNKKATVVDKSEAPITKKKVVVAEKPEKASANKKTAAAKKAVTKKQRQKKDMDMTLSKENLLKIQALSMIAHTDADDKLAEVIEAGKKKGSLTYKEINDAL